MAWCSYAQPQPAASSSPQWKMVPQQSVRSSFRKNFSYLHDKGFLMSMSLGPHLCLSYVLN
ncbi:MAG: hypothetical protein AAF320_05880 [Myxococcota bacterium]